MKRIIRILTVTLSLAIISASLNGCDIRKDVTSTLSELGAAEKKTGIDKIGYTLPYLRTDSLNPYKAQSGTNLALSVLLFDSLFKVDDAFKAQPLIAESYSQNSTILSVTLKSGLKFSDGTAVTAKDVIYSFNAAKESENYAVNLKNMSEASAQSGTKVNFSLYKQNQFEVNNLTFPVIKAGSDIDDKSSDDYSANVPVGSGRYTIVSGSEGKYLAANKSRLGEYLPEYNMIGLKDSTDESSLYNMFSLGEIDLYTENFSQGKYTRIEGETVNTNLTNFAFLGINSNRKALSDSRVRRAIALLINRTDLASVSFAGFAEAAVTPFHPDFYPLSGCTLPPIKTDKNAAVQLLEDAGFDRISELDIRYSDTSALNLTLTVNSENNFRLAMARNIQQALSKAGIQVTIRELSYNKYVSAIEYGSFDLYIGEAKLSNSFNLSEFFTEDGSLSYGIDKESKSGKAYFDFAAGGASLQSFLDVFADELPIIPLAYRQGAAIKSEKIETKLSSDYFLNIDEWTVK